MTTGIVLIIAIAIGGVVARVMTMRRSDKWRDALVALERSKKIVTGMTRVRFDVDDFTPTGAAFWLPDGDGRTAGCFFAHNTDRELTGAFKGVLAVSSVVGLAAGSVSVYRGGLQRPMSVKPNVPELVGPLAQYCAVASPVDAGRIVRDNAVGRAIAKCFDFGVDKVELTPSGFVLQFPLPKDGDAALDRLRAGAALAKALAGAQAA